MSRRTAVGIPASKPPPVESLDMKNDFKPVRDLQISDLPQGWRCQKALDVIHDVSQRVVMIYVPRMSSQRPVSIFSNLPHYGGTGFAYYVDRDVVRVRTNLHVIYNMEEASKAVVQFSLNIPGKRNTRLIRLQATTHHFCTNNTEDYSSFSCPTTKHFRKYLHMFRDVPVMWDSSFFSADVGSDGEASDFEKSLVHREIVRDLAVTDDIAVERLCETSNVGDDVERKQDFEAISNRRKSQGTLVPTLISNNQHNFNRDPLEQGNGRPLYSSEDLIVNDGKVKVMENADHKRSGSRRNHKQCWRPMLEAGDYVAILSHPQGLEKCFSIGPAALQNHEVCDKPVKNSGLQEGGKSLETNQVDADLITNWFQKCKNRIYHTRSTFGCSGSPVLLFKRSLRHMKIPVVDYSQHSGTCYFENGSKLGFATCFTPPVFSRSKNDHQNLQQCFSVTRQEEQINRCQEKRQGKKYRPVSWTAESTHIMDTDEDEANIGCYYSVHRGPIVRRRVASDWQSASTSPYTDISSIVQQKSEIDQLNKMFNAISLQEDPQRTESNDLNMNSSFGWMGEHRGISAYDPAPHSVFIEIEDNFSKQDTQATVFSPQQASQNGGVGPEEHEADRRLNCSQGLNGSGHISTSGDSYVNKTYVQRDSLRSSHASDEKKEITSGFQEFPVNGSAESTFACRMSLSAEFDQQLEQVAEPSQGYEISVNNEDEENSVCEKTPETMSFLPGMFQDSLTGNNDSFNGVQHISENRTNGYTSEQGLSLDSSEQISGHQDYTAVQANIIMKPGTQNEQNGYLLSHTKPAEMGKVSTSAKDEENVGSNYVNFCPDDMLLDQSKQWPSDTKLWQNSTFRAYNPDNPGINESMHDHFSTLLILQPTSHNNQNGSIKESDSNSQLSVTRFGQEPLQHASYTAHQQTGTSGELAENQITLEKDHSERKGSAEFPTEDFHSSCVPAIVVTETKFLTTAISHQHQDIQDLFFSSASGTAQDWSSPGRKNKLPSLPNATSKQSVTADKSQENTGINFSVRESMETQREESVWTVEENGSLQSAFFNAENTEEIIPFVSRGHSENNAFSEADSQVSIYVENKKTREQCGPMPSEQTNVFSLAGFEPPSEKAPLEFSEKPDSINATPEILNILIMRNNKETIDKIEIDSANKSQAIWPSGLDCNKEATESTSVPSDKQEMCHDPPSDHNVQTPNTTCDSLVPDFVQNSTSHVTQNLQAVCVSNGELSLDQTWTHTLFHPVQDFTQSTTIQFPYLTQDHPVYRTSNGVLNHQNDYNKGQDVTRSVLDSEHGTSVSAVQSNHSSEQVQIKDKEVEKLLPASFLDSLFSDRSDLKPSRLATTYCLSEGSLQNTACPAVETGHNEQEAWDHNSAGKSAAESRMPLSVDSNQTREQVSFGGSGCFERLHLSAPRSAYTLHQLKVFENRRKRLSGELGKAESCPETLTDSDYISVPPSKEFADCDSKSSQPIDGLQELVRRISKMDPLRVTDFRAKTKHGTSFHHIENYLSEIEKCLTPRNVRIPEPSFAQLKGPDFVSHGQMQPEGSQPAYFTHCEPKGVLTAPDTVFFQKPYLSSGHVPNFHPNPNIRMLHSHIEDRSSSLHHGLPVQHHRAHTHFNGNHQESWVPQSGDAVHNLVANESLVSKQNLSFGQGISKRKFYNEKVHGEIIGPADHQSSVQTVKHHSRLHGHASVWGTSSDLSSSYYTLQLNGNGHADQQSTQVRVETSTKRSEAAVPSLERNHLLQNPSFCSERTWTSGQRLEQFWPQEGDMPGKARNSADTHPKTAQSAYAKLFGMGSNSFDRSLQQAEYPADCSQKFNVWHTVPSLSQLNGFDSTSKQTQTVYSHETNPDLNMVSEQPYNYTSFGSAVNGSDARMKFPNLSVARNISESQNWNPAQQYRYPIIHPQNVAVTDSAQKSLNMHQYWSAKSGCERMEKSREVFPDQQTHPSVKGTHRHFKLLPNWRGRPLLGRNAPKSAPKQAVQHSYHAHRHTKQVVQNLHPSAPSDKTNGFVHYQCEYANLDGSLGSSPTVYSSTDNSSFHSNPERFEISFSEKDNGPELPKPNPAGQNLPELSYSKDLLTRRASLQWAGTRLGHLQQDLAEMTADTDNKWINATQARKKSERDACAFSGHYLAPKADTSVPSLSEAFEKFLDIGTQEMEEMSTTGAQYTWKSTEDEAEPVQTAFSSDYFGQLSSADGLDMFCQRLGTTNDLNKQAVRHNQRDHRIELNSDTREAMAQRVHHSTIPDFRTDRQLQTLPEHKVSDYSTFPSRSERFFDANKDEPQTTESESRCAEASTAFDSDDDCAELQESYLYDLNSVVRVVLEMGVINPSSLQGTKSNEFAANSECANFSSKKPIVSLEQESDWSAESDSPCCDTDYSNSSDPPEDKMLSDPISNQAHNPLHSEPHKPETEEIESTSACLETEHGLSNEENVLPAFNISCQPLQNNCGGYDSAGKHHLKRKSSTLGMYGPCCHCQKHSLEMQKNIVPHFVKGDIQQISCGKKSHCQYGSCQKLSTLCAHKLTIPVSSCGQHTSVFHVPCNCAVRHNLEGNNIRNSSCLNTATSSDLSSCPQKKCKSCHGCIGTRVTPEGFCQTLSHIHHMFPHKHVCEGHLQHSVGKYIVPSSSYMQHLLDHRTVGSARQPGSQESTNSSLATSDSRDLTQLSVVDLNDDVYACNEMACIATMDVLDVSFMATLQDLHIVQILHTPKQMQEVTRTDTLKLSDAQEENSSSGSCPRQRIYLKNEKARKRRTVHRYFHRRQKTRGKCGSSQSSRTRGKDRSTLESSGQGQGDNDLGSEQSDRELCYVTVPVDIGVRLEKAAKWITTQTFSCPHVHLLTPNDAGIFCIQQNLHLTLQIMSLKV